MLSDDSESDSTEESIVPYLQVWFKVAKERKWNSNTLMMLKTFYLNVILQKVVKIMNRSHQEGLTVACLLIPYVMEDSLCVAYSPGSYWYSSGDIFNYHLSHDYKSLCYFACQSNLTQFCNSIAVSASLFHSWQLQHFKHCIAK